jgi:SAM-dependent methyltransferase
MKLVYAPDGKCRLHVWRTGTAFEHTGRYELYREWNNLKFSSLPRADEPPFFYHHTLRKPLPWSDRTFDVVYCNHVAEHLTPDEGLALVREFRRVLKPGGLCRMVVPDLEAEAREYLRTLESALRDPSEENVRRYEWAVADLIDQALRRHTGGVMGQKLLRGDVDWEQIRRTNGDVFNMFLPDDRGHIASPPSLLDRLRRNLPGRLSELPRFVRKCWYRLLQEMLIRSSNQPRIDWLNETNRWLYDRFSLAQVLVRGGLADVQPVDYKTSRIEGWSRYDFDRSEKGDYPLEPSVYLEATRSAEEASGVSRAPWRASRGAAA